MRAAMVPLGHTSPAAPCLSLAQSLEYAHTMQDVSIPANPGRTTTSAGGLARLMKPQPTDHLLPKPDRAGLPPATIENGAGRGRCGVVRGCPLGTGRDRCEWHGSGTADEDDVRKARKSRHQLDRRVRPDPADTCLVGKGRRRPAAAVRWDSKPPPRCGGRGRGREGAATCDWFVPVVTVGVRRCPQIPDAVRTQNGPAHATPPPRGRDWFGRPSWPDGLWL
jgi:hypothetical protein